MGERWARLWAVVRRHPRRVIGALAATIVLVGVVAVVLGGGDEPVEQAETTDTSTSTTTTSTSTTTTSTTTTTVPPTTTTTAAPTTTTSAPPPPPRLVYAVGGSPRGLIAMNPDGSGVRTLLQGSFESLELSPDRSWLLMRVQAGADAGSLATVNADGSGYRVIATGGWQDPRISPDGTRIAVVKVDPARGPVLHLMNRDGSGQQPLYPPSGQTNTVEWSRDGTKLLITNTSSTGLSLYDLGTGQQQLILPGAAFDQQWSPDGSLIAFSNGRDLIVIAATGGADRILTPGSIGQAIEPVWDGASSLLFRDGAALYRVGLDGSPPVQIATGLTSPAS